MGSLRRVFIAFVDRAASRARRRHRRCPGGRASRCHAGLPGRRRLRKRHITAQQEIGWSEAFAASSVPAFELSRVTTDNSSRVTDVAARQRLLAAGRQGASGSRFPACSAGADRYGRPAWPATHRGALIRYGGSWELGVGSCATAHQQEARNRAAAAGVALPLHMPMRCGIASVRRMDGRRSRHRRAAVPGWARPSACRSPHAFGPRSRS